jgi:hypothetical protein
MLVILAFIALGGLPNVFAQQSVYGQCESFFAHNVWRKTRGRPNLTFIARWRYWLVRRQNLHIRKHMRGPERLLLPMPTGHRSLNNTPYHHVDHSPHHYFLDSDIHHFWIPMHNDNHYHNQHPHPHNLLFPFSHHHNLHQTSHHHHPFRHRSRLHPPDRLHLDPRRRRPKLPQIPANLPPQRRPRHGDPLLRHNRRAIPDRRRPADRADRHQGNQTVCQCGRGAEC